MQTVLIIGISGACRKEELKKLKITDVEDLGNKFLINIPTSKTKIERSFVVSGDFYNVSKRYFEIRLKLNESSITQFFMNYQKGKCTKQVVGINKIGSVPKQIAQYLKLENPSAYTSHCLRRTSATFLVNAGGDLLALKRHGGWRSSATAESYVDNSLCNQTNTANKIMEAIASSSTSRDENFDYIVDENQPSTSSSTTVVSHSASSRPLILKNCTNFTINYNYYTEKK